MEQTAPFTIDEVAMDVCALYILIFMLQENFVIINITLQGDVVGTIKATDRDEGPFRELNYELEAVFNTTGGQNTHLENYGLELVNGGPLSYNPDRIAEQNATGRRRPGRPTCPDRVQPRHLLDPERPDQNFPETNQIRASSDLLCSA